MVKIPLNGARQVFGDIADAFGHHYAEKHTKSEREGELILDFAHSLMDIFETAAIDFKEIKTSHTSEPFNHKEEKPNEH